MQDVTVELAGGKQIKFETGRLAKQASGAAFTTSGDNAVLATAVASPEPKEGIDFFPLTVESGRWADFPGRVCCFRFIGVSSTWPSMAGGSRWSRLARLPQPRVGRCGCPRPVSQPKSWQSNP